MSLTLEQQWKALSLSVVEKADLSADHFRLFRLAAVDLTHRDLIEALPLTIAHVKTAPKRVLLDWAATQEHVATIQTAPTPVGEVFTNYVQDCLRIVNTLLQPKYDLRTTFMEAEGGLFTRSRAPVLHFDNRGNLPRPMCLARLGALEVEYMRHACLNRATQKLVNQAIYSQSLRATVRLRRQGALQRLALGEVAMLLAGTCDDGTLHCSGPLPRQPHGRRQPARSVLLRTGYG